MSVDMSRHFTTGQLVRYALPAIAMTLFTSIYGIVDGLFVSNFTGTTAFAAVNLILPFVMIMSSFGFMVGTGGTAIISKVRGQGNEEGANRLFSLFVYFTLVVGVVASVAGALGMEWVARAFGAEGELLEMAVLYGRISMISLTMYMLQNVFQSFYSAAGKPSYGLYVTIASGVTNMVLDAILIGYFDLGVVGAASATVCAEFIGGGVPLIYFARKNNSSFFRLGRAGLDARALGRCCMNGSSEMMTNIAVSVVSMVYNLQLMSLVGENGVAAYGMIMYVFMVFAAVFMGYNIGTSPLLSYQHGAGSNEEKRSLFKKSLALTGVFGVCMLALAQAFAGPISFAFTGYDPELCAFTERAFRIYSLSFLLVGFSMYGSALFTALNNGLISALISFLRTLVFETGAVLLLPLVLGVDGIWCSVLVAEVASVLVTAVFVLYLGPTYGILPKRGKK
ncbi:MAG: MATE family efflux transporter [Coriobacteriia bacterium]|nr:MATE family efflux transporter [Coriobacteriia bacterium]